MIYGWAAAPLDFPFAKNIVQTERNTRPDHNTVKYCRSYADIRETTAYYNTFFVSVFLIVQTYNLVEFTLLVTSLLFDKKVHVKAVITS